LKIYLGSGGGSHALLADGFHAAVDVLSDAVAIIALALATRAPSRRCQFPFGVGRAESVGAVVIASILLAGAFGVAWGAARTLWVDCLQPLISTTSSTADNHHDHDGHAHTDDHHGHSHDHHDSHDDHHGHSHFSLTERNVHGETVILWTMLGVAASSVVVKEMLYRVMSRAARRAGSASV
jgi:divalent metal cation (Fe/Co/Zn/Cd) transporter